VLRKIAPVAFAAICSMGMTACDFSSDSSDDNDDSPGGGAAGQSAGAPGSGSGGSGGTSAPVAGTGGTQVGGSGGASGGTNGTAPADYPAGPYGLLVGNVVDNLAFKDADGKDVDFASLRAQPGVKVILWKSGTEWCSVCKQQVPKLKSLVDTFDGRGLAIVETLHQDKDFNASDAQTLARWESAFSPNFPVWIEKSPPYESRGQNPIQFVIDAKTMVVRSRGNGSSLDAEAEINAALSAAE